jgi:hypothetical protein
LYVDLDKIDMLAGYYLVDGRRNSAGWLGDLHAH